MNRNIVVTSVVFLLAFALLSSQFSNAQSGTPMPPPAMTATAIAPSPTPSPTPRPEQESAINYIAEKYNIPIDELLVVNAHQLEYELLERTFLFVSIMDTRTIEENTYDVLVDLESGEIADDLRAIDAAEQDAYFERYGKLHPSLYKRLQEIDANAIAPVTFWISPAEGGRTRKEIYAILVARYPEAAEALEKWGRPWAVPDAGLRATIRNEYWQMRDEDVEARIEPLVTELNGLGFVVETYEGLPSVSANLPKHILVRQSL